MDIIEIVVIIIFSASIHEVAHGLVAEYLGDDTARRAGRITLNPLVHIDPLGSVIIPILALLTHVPLIGAAKPVPVDYDFLKPRRLGIFLVSLAGPASNFIMACLFALLIKIGVTNDVSTPILIQAIFINLGLFVLNILPIPPLDGSKMLLSVIASDSVFEKVLSVERFGMVLVLLAVMSGVLYYIYIPLLNFFFSFFKLPLSF